MAIDMNEINEEITKLENSDTNWKNCEKLSVLYGVRGGMNQKAQPYVENSYSYASAPIMNGSEFVKVASSVPFEHLLSVLDEHMEIIKAIYPKEYRIIIKRLNHIEP